MQTIKISSIKLNPNNPRTIKDDKFKKLVKSLKEFPEMTTVRPVVVNKDMVILGGNMRYKAAIEAGWKEIPVEIVDWSEDKQREFIIKDNVSGGDWDYDLLANEWEADKLDEWGLDVDWKDDSDIEEDEAPEVSQEPPVSKLGGVYQLGRHRVMCGDSTKIEDVEKLMDGKKADMLLTDPPYGIDLDTDYSGMPSRWNNKEMYQGKYEKVKGDDKLFDASGLLDLAKEVFLWGADYYAHSLPQSGIKGTWYVWDKREDNDGDSFDKMLGSPFELCWGKKKRGKKFIRMRWASFLHSDATEGEKSSGRIHPTQKPIALMSWFIKQFSKQEDIVLDLFGGSGSTLIACEQTNRTCYMMELDPKYVDVIRKRYHKFTNENNEEGWQEATPAIL